MMCQNMGMIAEKIIVLWPVLLGGGGGKAPPCSFHTVLQAAAYRVNGTTYYDSFYQSIMINIMIHVL